MLIGYFLLPSLFAEFGMKEDLREVEGVSSRDIYVKRELD